MSRKAFVSLLCCLLVLALLSGCGSGGQVAGQPFSASETNSPEQSVEEVHPEEDQTQAEAPAPETETNDHTGGEEAAPAVPQSPGTDGEQEQPAPPDSGTAAPDDEPAEPPAAETPGETSAPSEPAPGHPAAEDTGDEKERTEMKLTVQVGESFFPVTLEDNAAVEALVELLEHGPVTLQLSDYGGFEKVGPLRQSLPTSNQQTTTQAGDIVLYQGNQIVLFYGSNAWSYTRLGRIDDLTGWAEALGSGDVSVTFSLTE